MEFDFWINHGSDVSLVKEIFDKSRNSIVSELNQLGVELDSIVSGSCLIVGTKEFLFLQTEFFPEKAEIKEKLEELGWVQHGDRVNSGEGFRNIRMKKTVSITIQ